MPWKVLGFVLTAAAWLAVAAPISAVLAFYFVFS